MATLFQQIQAGDLWDFHGGIHPPGRKERTNHKPVALMDIPAQLYIPLRQHIGVAGQLQVKVGERVLKGQALTKASNAMAVPVHAPTSGVVTAIEVHPSAHPSALPEPTLILEPDGLDEWRPRQPLDPDQCDAFTLLERIQDAGIAGMGGAGFPSHLKLSSKQPVDYLIINAVECEPYITADDLLMQERASDILAGIEILMKLLNPKAVLIGIEDDKPIAAASLKAAIGQKEHIFVREVPTKYPSGGEKQLIRLLTSKEVPAGRRPLDIGIVMQNVGTAFAIAQAVLDDIPLIHRVVTVAGDTLNQQQNMLTLIGTPVSDLLSACGFNAEPQQRIIMGGPMMGFTLADWRIPVVKTTNCILAPTDAELPAASNEMDCIRCGACADACPASLLPQQLLWYSKAKDQDKLKEYNLSDCIECGACAYVCPSEIPLVQYYRVAKAEIREAQREELKAEQAKARFDARTERLEREKQERLEKNQQLAAQRLAAQQAKGEAETAASKVQQALERVQQKAQPELDKAAVQAERERRKAEALAYQQQKRAADQGASGNSEQPATAEVVAGEDPRKAAIAAALARAKAKKAQQTDDHGAAPSVTAGSADTAPVETAPVAEAEDPRKAAVAAAIARAKAKKAQQTDDYGAAPSVTAGSADTAPVKTAPVAEAEDPRKAAVAAAIARAKAKKAQQTDDHGAAPSVTAGSADTAPLETAPVAEAEDPRKAAVAAAIARAKAKKAQQAATESDITTETASQPEPPETATVSEPAPPVPQDSSADAATAKKAAIAAAIARAKAKKAQDNEPS
ncbi:electron transport complex subunit RsxC [Rheinheimera marina]|uniref:Ion-translocating oxidoreductase complex subunit C n=1 Tax=Rheinheimera marina TaxID=1774958 RepID=A0ABV9JRB0_9GAMM